MSSSFLTVTNIILVLTGLISYSAFNNVSLLEKLKHHPYSETRYKEYYRLLTSGFVHNDFLHLAINMFVLWQFGSVVERIYIREFGAMGMFLYLAMYLTAIVFANLPSLRKHKDDSYYAAVGASGAVAAVMFTIVLFAPWSGVRLYGIIPLRIIVGAILYLVYEQWAGQNKNDNIGHDAHFAGAIYGILFIVVLNPSIYNDFVDKLINQMPSLMEIFIFNPENS
jgi:membrane associated rhomboid family serine protease